MTDSTGHDKHDYKIHPPLLLDLGESMSPTELIGLSSDDTRDPADHAWNAAIKYVTFNVDLSCYSNIESPSYACSPARRLNRPGHVQNNSFQKILNTNVRV